MAKQDELSRKVQFTGGSTYIISLPKKWISQNQIKKGAFIKLREEEGGLLTIVPPSPNIPKKLDQAIIIVISGDTSEKITRKIVSAYLAGYTIIQIKAHNQSMSTKQRHDIKNLVRQMLVGTEIVSDTSSQLVLQVLLSYPELSIQSALRRMTIITVSMLNDATKALETKDVVLAKEVISSDNDVDRFNLYVIRLLKKAIFKPRIIDEIGLRSNDDCFGYRIITKYVERTADHAVNIANNVLSLKNNLNNDTDQKIRKMSNAAIKMFSTSMESLFRQDYYSAEKIIQNIIEVVDLEKEAVTFSLNETADGANLRLIIESIRRTAEYACDIGEIVLNLTIDSVLE